jgi:GrpB-like predicted nucleotidyltransferase (UPF0157 family)
MSEIDEPIHLSSYDQEWPRLYQSEARRIQAVLPADVAVEHIGTTSVAGLLAKPIIDIILGLAACHDQNKVRATPVTLGYKDLGEAGVPGRLYFRRRGKTAFNIALVKHGGPIWTANLAFRNYLRTHPEAAREYAETKRAAIQSGTRTLLAYSDYKSVVLRRLLDKLCRWTSKQSGLICDGPPSI